MARNLTIRNAVRLALAANIGLVSLSVAPGVLGAEQAGDVEEVITTGSRIPKQDYLSNAPVATVGFEQIEMTGTVNTESLLNTLPQAVPGLDRTSNNPGNGTATVNLRGLGSNRTLVLIDGVRVVPTSSGGSVDINSIPNALIEKIEVLTGGASAVYGSDAVAGVVNFIMKDDFEGVAVNIGTEQTFDSDAGISSADITIGANTADGRGNVTLNFAYTDREELFQGDRDFSFFAQTDSSDAMGNPILINGGSSGIPGTSIFAGGLGTFSPDSFGVTFDGNGNIRPFDTSGNENDFYNYAPVNYIQLPQTRYQTTALGKFEINDKSTAYGRAHFTTSKVPQQLAPTPIFQSGTQVTLDGSPFLTALSQQTLSDAFGDGVDTDMDGIDDTGTMFLRRRLVEVGPRIADSAFTSFQIQGGMKGDITDTWSYDAYYQIGQVTNNGTQDGNVSRNRFEQALLLDLAADPTGGTCTDTSANGATIGCAPINIFGEGNISADGAAFLRTAVASTADYEQKIVGLTFTGDLGGLELPGGGIATAVGYEKIKDKFDFRPSQDLASGNIAGFNGSPPVSGRVSVDSFFGELYLPILDNLDLELAYRSSDYTTAGSVQSYKIGGSFAPVDAFRFRGGFNRAVRAPSIGELFSPQGENFPGAQDPCSANGMPDAATQAICIATGVPAGVVGTPAINLAAGQVRAITGGNPLLNAEEADTYTFGFVAQPMDDLSFSLDYFDITIDGYITEFGGGASNVLNTCYDPNEAAGGVGSPFCDVVNRRADGTIDFVLLSSANVAEQTLTGFDLLAGYDFDVMNGAGRLNYIATYTTEQNFTAFPGAVTTDCAGAFGQNICGEPLPEYKHRATFNWTKDDLSGMLSWRYIGEVTDDDPDNTYFVEKIGAESYFDLSGTYRFADNYAITLGIDNVADTKPPILGTNQEQANTWPATYDVFGRTWFLRLSSDFSN